MVKNIFLWAMLLLLQACTPQPQFTATQIISDPITEHAKVKNIILMIGDGMGPVHRQLADILSPVGLAKMNDFVIKGLVRTASANDYITDSAASATAMATGVKTHNKVVGLDADLSYLQNIIEIAQQHAKATGIITNTQLSHATPAAFSAHINSRYNMEAIADQQIQADVDVLMGGGENYFLPKNQTGCFPEKGKREDALNLIKRAEDKGYHYICSAEALAGLNSQKNPRVLGIFADEGLKLPFSPSLALMTQKSIEILDQHAEGFVLIIEGGQIDWASHANNAEAAMLNLNDFDAAVKVAKAYISKRDDTLLIITADHETGGLSIHKTSGDEGPFKDADGHEFYISWSTKSHTAVDVPLTAMGPMSTQFVGTYENTRIFDLMKSAIID